MKYKQFDRSKLNVKPLEERLHDVDISVIRKIDCDFDFKEDKKYDHIAEALIEAKTKGATSMMMYGAHVIRTGNGLFMIEMMKRGLITHFSTNGAGAIHDFELSMIGATCESVAKYISEGQFGLWRETGLLNQIVEDGVKEGYGFGQAVGKFIWENNFEYREKSVLAMGYHLGVPCTVHIGIGNDITNEHPNCSGAAIGEASYIDFLIYTESITKLENGVFLNFGSAVTGPEVYLKALSMARNVAHQNGEKIADFTTAVFDILPIEGYDFSATPPKTDPRYYFRPWKTILSRTVADGGKSYYISGEHQVTVPNLANRAFKLDMKR